MIDAVTALSVILAITSIVMVCIAWHHDKLVDQRDELRADLDTLEEQYWALLDAYCTYQDRETPIYPPTTQLHG